LLSHVLCSQPFFSCPAISLHGGYLLCLGTVLSRSRSGSGPINFSTFSTTSSRSARKLSVTPRARSPECSYHQSSVLAGALSSVKMLPQEFSYRHYRPQSHGHLPPSKQPLPEQSPGWREDTAETLYRVCKTTTHGSSSVGQRTARGSSRNHAPRHSQNRRKKSVFTSSCHAWASCPSCHPCPSSPPSPRHTRARPCASWS